MFYIRNTTEKLKLIEMKCKFWNKITMKWLMLDLIDMSQLIVLMFSYNKIKTVEVDRWAPPRKYVDTGCVPTDKSACLSIWSAC